MPFLSTGHDPNFVNCYSHLVELNVYRKTLSNRDIRLTQTFINSN